MTKQTIDGNAFVEQFENFFRTASMRKPIRPASKLDVFFRECVTSPREKMEALLQTALNDFASLDRFADELKEVADIVHPDITKNMSSTSILGYTLNTLADGLRIPLEKRFEVSDLPPHMSDHGDSLFISEQANQF